MQNFDYQTPTRLIFGKDVIQELPEVMKQFGKRILLSYGSGSVLDCSKAIITPRRKVRGDTQQELHKEVRRTIYEDIDY